MSDADPLRIGFVRMGPHPIPNRLVPDALAAALGGACVEVFDVEAVVRRDPLSLIVNPFFVLREYAAKLLGGEIRPWRAFVTTPWMFRRMGRLARRFLERGGYDASFQMQSLFDATAPGIPHFVYTDHTHLANLGYPDFDRSALRGERWIELERALYHRASAVFTRSEHVSRSLREDYGCTPEQVVCVGAGSNARVPEAHADADVTASRAHPPRILFVGVDWERKGGPELVAAFSRILASHPDARLTIVGCQPEVDAPNVDVIGRCPVETVHRHYREASIFCMPVRREPFGVAFVEAMHHALPVVSTRVGALPDLVSDGVNGYLVEVGDVDALARHLERLLEDPDVATKMGERSLERARNGYTWAGVAERQARTIRGFLP